MNVSHMVNSTFDFAEAMMELYEEERDCHCPHCHLIESLSFFKERLASSPKKWKQLDDGTIIHLCEMNPLTKAYL